MHSIRYIFAIFLGSWLLGISVGWVLPSTPSRSVIAAQQWQTPSCLFSTTKTSNDEKEKASEKVNDDTTTSKSDSEATSSKKDSEVTPKAVSSEADDDEEDDDDEFEFIEYDDLTEADFLGSEWMVGTCWDSNNNQIKETWVRLAVKGDKNLAVWGDNSEGTWSLDAASQFLAISKNFIWGKQIWAGVVDDYYFVQGTVRGWTYLTPASVLGQWQGKRLGVDPEEAGTAPWFLLEEDDEDNKEEKADDDEEEEQPESKE
ncbi:expressed unknown protein [Seminavis robusta]|uniref:Uncharacterized protein n=1 Tax=Seminavis robusta TaxID=568900 RepID=A0A9N8HJ34_9STRA|nr:expressed unknown protein [Seminavis robusta]|eukprot:Sro665_g183850.1 n/a (259) ;mRNA; r:27818-28594